MQQTLTVTLLQIVSLFLLVCRHANQISWEEAWLMKFNVAKCHSMRVTRHPRPKQIIYGYTLHNQVLENVSSAKYLGVKITDDLEWSQHINEITRKATETLGFLRRNLTFA